MFIDLLHRFVVEASKVCRYSSIFYLSLHVIFSFVFLHLLFTFVVVGLFFVFCFLRCFVRQIPQFCATGVFFLEGGFLISSVVVRIM